MKANCGATSSYEETQSSAGQVLGRTILVDLKPSLTELHEGMFPLEE